MVFSRELQNTGTSPPPFRAQGCTLGTAKPVNGKGGALHPQNATPNLLCRPPPTPCRGAGVLGVLPRFPSGNCQPSPTASLLWGSRRAAPTAPRLPRGRGHGEQNTPKQGASV